MLAVLLRIFGVSYRVNPRLRLDAIAALSHTRAVESIANYYERLVGILKFILTFLRCTDDPVGVIVFVFVFEITRD
jgi:hypothetical protein